MSNMRPWALASFFVIAGVIAETIEDALDVATLFVSYAELVHIPLRVRSGVRPQPIQHLS
jgi:hypothetical protein